MTPSPAIDKFEVVNNPPAPQVETESFEARLLKLVQRLDGLTKTSRKRRHYIWAMLDLFAKGLHFVSYDPNKVTLEEWDAMTIAKCMYTPVPLVEQAVETIASQYLTSKPHIRPLAPAEDVKTKAVLRDLQTVSDSLFSKFYLSEPEERQREAKLMPVRSIVYNFLEFDKTKGPEYEIPQLEPVPQRFCADCGYEVRDGLDMGGGGDVDPDSPSPLAGAAMGDGEMASGGECPHCGNQNIETVMGVENRGPTKARQGEIIRHTPDPFQVEIFDRRFKVEQSTYLIYDEILFTCELKKLYPHVNIKGKASLGNSTDGYCGLHYKWQVETLISNTGKLDQGRPDYQITYGGSYLDESMGWRRRVWVDPVEYSGDEWVLPRPTMLPGTNQLVPAGTKVIDMFPDGLVIHIVNGKSVAKLDNQNKNNVWSCYKFRVPTTGLHGNGVAPQISLNRAYDELTSFQLQAALMNALGITLMDESVRNYENIPGQFYWVTRDSRPMGEPLESLIAHKDTGGPSADAEAVRLSFRQQIADASMTANPNASGLQREGMKTATGVEYQAGIVNTLTAPPLELFANGCAKVIQQAVQLERKMGTRPRFYSRHGETTGRWFQPMDIPADITFIVAEDSYQPRTMQTEKEDLAGAINLGVGAGTLPPVMEEKGARLFGLDGDSNSFTDWSVKMEKRFDAMKMVAPEIEAMPLPEMPPEIDPATGELIPPDPVKQVALMIIEAADALPRERDDPGMCVRYWNEQYLTDEYDEMSPALRMATDLLWQMHQQAGAVLAAKDQQRALTATAPARDAAKQDMSEQQGLQEESEAGERGASSEQEAVAHEREESSKDRDHERALELQDKKAQSAKEIETVRARGRATQKKKGRK